MEIILPKFITKLYIFSISGFFEIISIPLDEKKNGKKTIKEPKTNPLKNNEKCFLKDLLFMKYI